MRASRNVARLSRAFGDLCRELCRKLCRQVIGAESDIDKDWDKDWDKDSVKRVPFGLAGMALV
jgi:hypothetical protein